MVDLKTNYAGLQLDNPLIVSSSGLTDNLEKVKRMAGFGPGAIVLKSLFEEQINIDSGRVTDDFTYPEAADYILNYTRSHAVGDYLDLISGAKKSIGQPVIASINCTSGNGWTGFAKQISNAGADAIELNMFILPVAGHAHARLEDEYLEIARKIRETVSVPVIVKLSPYFTNLPAMIDRFHAIGVKGAVLFNSLYEPDIDVENMKVTSSEVLSSPSDLSMTLRWVGLVADKEKRIHISGSNGVHDGAAVVKLLLAGAQTVQVCSALYRNGPEYIERMLNDLTAWMDRHGYQSPDDFRGRMGYRNLKDPATWERVQFMRYYAGRD